jgi:magnesium transporter
MTLVQRLARQFLVEHPAEGALALERLPLEQRAAVVGALPGDAAPALARMTPFAAAECLARLTPEQAAGALERLTLDTALALLRALPGESADRVVRGLPAERQEALQRVLRYPEGTAGALMDPSVLSLPDDITIGEAKIRVRRQGRGVLYYLFVVDRDRRLVGVLDVPELMSARTRDTVRAAMHEPVQHLPAWTPAAAVRTHPGWRSFHAMPVTDEAGRLVGAIRYQTLRRLEQDASVGRAGKPSDLTVGALGELFQIGISGFVEGVAAAAPGATRSVAGTRRQGVTP